MLHNENYSVVNTKCLCGCKEVCCTSGAAAGDRRGKRRGTRVVSLLRERDIDLELWEPAGTSYSPAGRRTEDGDVLIL